MRARKQLITFVSFLLCAAAGLASAETACTFQQGRVAVYGSELEGQPTASGEAFSSEALTAAHRSLPFGTRLLVTNVGNGKQCVVRVNDRGPEERGQVLAVSDMAARVLGVGELGAADVRLELLGEVPPTQLSGLTGRKLKRLEKDLERARRDCREADLRVARRSMREAVLVAAGHEVVPVSERDYVPFAIMVGVFRDQETADAMVAKLVERKQPAWRSPAREVHRVMVGPYRFGRDAERAAKHLQGLGLKTTVVELDDDSRRPVQGS